MAANWPFILPIYYAGGAGTRPSAVLTNIFELIFWITLYNHVAADCISMFHLQWMASAIA